MTTSQVEIDQSECIARDPESYVDQDEIIECFIDVMFNNEGTLKREYLYRTIRVFKCGCLMIDTVEDESDEAEGT